MKVGGYEVGWTFCTRFPVTFDSRTRLGRAWMRGCAQMRAAQDQLQSLLDQRRQRNAAPGWPET